MPKLIKKKLGALKVKENLKEVKELCAEDLQTKQNPNK